MWDQLCFHFPSWIFLMSYKLRAAGMHLMGLLSIPISMFVVIDWHTSLLDVIHYHNSQPNHYYRKMTLHLTTSGNNSFQYAALLMLN